LGAGSLKPRSAAGARLPSPVIDADLQRARRQRAFHNDRYEDDPRRTLSRYYAASAGRRAFTERMLDVVRGRDVLECGCGKGGKTLDLAPLARRLVAIDLSDVAVARAARRPRLRRARVRFGVMDASRLAFADETFDAVVGSSLLHHVPFETACREIARVLRPGGVALFFEPLGTNPVINAFRRFTPEHRSHDERPLTRADVEAARRVFDAVEVEPFDLFTLAAVLTPRADRARTALARGDAWLFRSVPAARALAWNAVLEFRKAA
jgi:SAM-dependent methyltransferase